VGTNALSANQTGAYLTAVGAGVLAQATGGWNTAVGAIAGSAITSGTYNTMIGAMAGDAQTSAVDCTAVGAFALSENQSGGSNTAIGRTALFNNTTGSNTVALGFEALKAQTTATGNIAVGRMAGKLIQTGNYNTIIGKDAGDNITTGSTNICIGSSADVPSATGSNQLNIGGWITGAGGVINIPGSLTVAGSPVTSSVSKVTMAYNSSSRTAFGYTRDLFARNNEMVGGKVGFAFVKASASTDIMVVFSMQVAAMRDCYQCATYSGTNYNSTFFKRFAFSGTTSIGDNNANQGMTITGTAIYPASELNSTGTKQFYWAMGRLNDGNNSSYILNPNASDYSNFGGATTSTITVYEGDFT